MIMIIMIIMIVIIIIIVVGGESTRQGLLDE
jgi:hypothetical protein